MGFSKSIYAVMNSIVISAKWIHAFAVAYFLFVTLGAVFTCVFVAYPVVFRDEEVQLTYNTVFLFFVFFNILGNYLLGFRSNSFFKSALLQLPVIFQFLIVSGILTLARFYKSKSGKVLVDPPRSWIFCSVCNQHSPPRSHHCPVCKVCVLKRDHHCYFLCQCVGLRNQKFFIIFAMYVVIGCLYVMKILLSYLNITYVPIELSFFSISSYFFPMLLYNWIWTDVPVTFYTCLSMIILYCCFSASLGCMFLFFSQCALVYRGQTTFEFLKRLPPSSSIDNFSQVFGNCWVLQFFIPLPIGTKEEKSPWGYPVYYKSV